MGNAQLGAEIANHVDLVFHQRNQRGDNDGRAFRHECRQLVAQRFAASCWHQYEGIASAKDAFDDLLLVALELVKTENIFQKFVYLLVIFFCHDFLLLVFSKFLCYFAISFESLRYLKESVSALTQRQSYSFYIIQSKKKLRKNEKKWDNY